MGSSSPHTGGLNTSPGVNTTKKAVPTIQAVPTGAMTTPGVGSLSEADAAALANRYTGLDALAGYRNARSPEVSSLISKAMNQTNGINAGENAAIRQNALSSVASQNEANIRAQRATAAASGVRGGVAQAQNANTRAAASGQIGTAERNLTQDNIQYKQDALKNASAMVGNQENVERDMGADKLATVLGIRAENAALTGAKYQAQAAAAAGGGGAKK